jgi:hypothetical protein
MVGGGWAVLNEEWVVNHLRIRASDPRGMHRDALESHVLLL